MNVDYLIIGQGISGTWLSYFLHQEGKRFIVIDNNLKDAPSRIAAGIINPVTGRRHVTVWLANEIIPFARDAYRQIGSELGIAAISQKNIIDFFPGTQMRLGFLQRIDEDDTYVQAGKNENEFREYFNYDFGFGQIRPVYTAHLETLLPAWRQQLKIRKQLLEEEFKIPELTLSGDKIHYKDMTASAVIFCDGNSSIDNPYFKPLPFAPNKGEALLVEITDLPRDKIYKRGLVLVPLDGSEGNWWIGSNYAWEFDNVNPTREFREKTEQLLKVWLNRPFRIIDHLSGIRPATLERRPFAGMHPKYPAIGILNGMGTKGCSLAPFFARQFAEHLVHGQPINPEADIRRFQKILSR